jgi:predicted O-methyltransferase YrrM
MSQLSRWVIRPLRNLMDDWRGARDARELAELGVGSQPFEQARAAAARELRPAYEEYIATVSTGDMAVSWETACLLYALACMLRPREALDLGSGFSSYVLRKYAAQSGHECLVTSIDDNRHWLDQTRAYLQRKGLNGEQVDHWDEFCRQAPIGKFDLVFHDLGDMEQRAAALPMVLKCLAPRGVLVLDDMHKSVYRRTAERQAVREGWRVLSARRQTLDGIGRFSEIALRQSA